MNKSNNEINFYYDSLIVETFLSDHLLVKNAQGSVISQLIEKVKSYFGSKIDPNDKTNSFLNMIAPGAISLTMRALGLGWISWLFGLAIEIFHIDVAGILSDIYSKLKVELSSSKSTNSNRVDSIVQDSVNLNIKPSTEQEAQESVVKMQSAAMELREAQLIKIATVNFYEFKNGIRKDAGILDAFNGKKSKVVSVLVRVLQWLFKVALASAGLMVAGDLVNKMLGRPNSLDGSYKVDKQKSTETENIVTTTQPLKTSTQTKYKVKRGYKEEGLNVGNEYWEEVMPANESSISQMLVNFAKEVYDGLDSLDSVIKSSIGFKSVLSKLLYVNRNNIGTNIVTIPRGFHSKKQIVDMFIDDVAEKT